MDQEEIYPEENQIPQEEYIEEQQTVSVAPPLEGAFSKFALKGSHVELQVVRNMVPLLKGKVAVFILAKATEIVRFSLDVVDIRRKVNRYIS